MGQIVPVANVFKDLKKCILKENETKIAQPLYDIQIGKCLDLEETITLINIREGSNKAFKIMDSKEKLVTFFTHFRKKNFRLFLRYFANEM